MFSTTRVNRSARSRAPRFIAITTGTVWYSSGRRGNLRDDSFFSSNAVAQRVDPFLGRADALAGGHIGAGETYTSAARRELIEEVGLQAGPKDLIHLGSGLKLRPISNCRSVVEHHLLYRGAVDMDKLSFSPEVDGFFLVALQDFIGLLSGRRTRIAASIRTREGTALGELRADEMIDYPDAILDTFRRSMASLSEWLATGVANPRHFE